MVGHQTWPSGMPAGWGRAPRRPSRQRSEQVHPRTNVRVCVWDASTPELAAAAAAGRGRLLAEERGHNRVPNSGRNLLRDLLTGDAVTGVTKFALGTGATATTNADVALVAEVLRADVSQLVKSSLTLTVKYFLSSVTLNGTTIREAGLFNTAGTLIARYVLPTPIAKTSAIAVTFSWSITFTGDSALMVLERGSVVELGGDPNTFVVGNAYPSGATLDKIVNGSSTWLIDSVDLDPGTYCLEAHLKVTNGTATPTVALFDLSGATPDVALTGSAVAGAAGNQVGTVVRSGAITFPAPGLAKRLAVKAKTDEAAGEAIAWGLRIIRLT